MQPTLIVSTGLNGRSGAAERVHPSGQQPERSTRTTSCPARWAATTRSSSAATGATRTRRRSATPAASRRSRFPTARRRNDCSLGGDAAARCDLTRDGYSVYDLLNNVGLRAGHVTHGRADAAARRPLRLQPRQGAGAASIAANPLVPAAGCRRSTSPAPIRASRSTTSRRASASPTTSPATARRSRAPTTRATTARSAPAASPARSTRSARRRSGIRGSTRTATASADVGEITLSGNPLSGEHATGPRRTRRTRSSANSVDPNLKNDTTDEFIVGVDREIGAGFAVGANYIWRRYGNFQWNDRVGITSADWVADDVHAGREHLPGRRRHAHRRGELPDGHLLPADVPAADGHRR